MNTQQEWIKATALKAELESLIRDLTELRPEYLPFQGMLAELLLGEVPSIIVQCDGEECHVEGREPVGGLWSSYRYLVEVIVSLELELDYEHPSAKMDPDYEI